MKNRYLKGLLGATLGALLISTSSYAVSNLKLQEETTDVYKMWQALSTEEQQNYIEPLPYSLTIDDSVRLSVFNKFTRGVGIANTETSYNLYKDVPFKIKNQEDTNECWAFATTTALETNAVKTRNKTIELSPRHIDYATSRTFLDGINPKGYHREIGFGNFYISLSYCTSGNGPVLEASMPFENNEEKVALSEIEKDPVLKIEDYVQFATIYKKYSEDGTTMKYTNGATTEYTEAQVEGVRNLIKQHVKQYGGVLANIYIGKQDILDRLNMEKVNEGKAETLAYCSKNSSALFDHAVTIVGWDDEYSKENFNDKNKPEKDGAYLVVNTSAGENGVLSAMYVSYEDVWIEYSNFGVVSTSDIDYDTIYQYDEYGYDVSLPLKNSTTGEATKTAYAANVFTRQQTEKEEYLHEVSVHISTTSNVEIYANVESDDKTKIEKVASAGILEPGYHTVKLATPLKLTGDKFVVAMKLTADEVKVSTETSLLSNGGTSNYWDYATSEAGQSFISEDGATWEDMHDMLNDSNVCIKAFTTYQEKAEVAVSGITLNKTTVEMQEGETLSLAATITPNDATNKKVKWSSSNEKVATISETGIMTALKEGTTTITVTTEDGNKTATCTITVKPKTNKEDDVYYPQGGESNGKDTTIATGTIPQTGVSYLVVMTAVGIITISAVLAKKQSKKYKDIK